MYNRSVNKLKYLSVAVNALKKLKNQSVVAAKGENIRGGKGKPITQMTFQGFLWFICNFL